jgi:hypothetical protein
LSRAKNVHSPRSNHEFYLYLDGLIYLEFRILANKSESVYDKLKKKRKKKYFKHSENWKTFEYVEI